MKKLPKTKCWRVGHCNVDVVDAIDKFNSTWNTELIVGQHDCRHYTNGIKIAISLLTKIFRLSTRNHDVLTFFD